MLNCLEDTSRLYSKMGLGVVVGSLGIESVDKF